MTQHAIWKRHDYGFWVFHVWYWATVWAARELFAAVFPGSEAATGPAFPARLAVAAIATAVLRHISLQKEGLRKFRLTRFGALAGGAICLAVVMTLIRSRVEPGVEMASPLGGPGEAVAILLINATALLGWAFCYLTFRLIDDHEEVFVRELEARAAADRNELKHLQATMNPHFLFNSLSAVMAMKHDPEGVEQVTQALADYLRFTLRETALQEPLGRELDALDDYIAIQDARFGEDLVCSIACDRLARSLLVPPMFIQPLLENALKYGADTSPRPLRVEVRVDIDGDTVLVEVANTGQWVPPERHAGSGLGMRTLRTRLRMLYGAAADVSHTAEQGWVRVVVRLPWCHPAPAEEPVLPAEEAVLT